MQQFVLDKNNGADGTNRADAPGAKSGFEDLKYAVPKRPALNTAQWKSRSQPGNQAGQVRTDSRAQDDRQQPRRPSDGQPTFYDTDVSSIGKSSTTVSVQQSIAGAARDHQRLPAAAGDGHGLERPSSLEESDGGEDESDDDLPNDPRQRTGCNQTLSPENYQLMADIDAQLKRKRDETGFPYTKGDSYPTTTSGRPSDAGENDYAVTQHSNWQQNAQSAHQTSLPNRDSSHRQQLGPVSTQKSGQARQPSIQGQSVQPSASKGPIPRPDAPDERSLKHQAAADISSNKRTNPPVAVRPPQSSRQQSAPVLPSSKATISANIAQSSSVPAAGEIPQRQTQHFDHKSEAVRDDSTLRKYNNASKSGRKSRTSKPVQAQAVETPPEYERLSDAQPNVHSEMPAVSHTRPQHRESEIQLDHQTEKLFYMSYKDLKAESFDVDPNGNDSHVPAEQQNEPFADRLCVISELQQQDQINFFASLPIDEWEQAGDWFLDRFGEVLCKLKQARQEKRTAAKLFEDEIEQRYKAINKKRKQTEEYLSDMKESGGKVLQSTPKKVKAVK